MLRSSLLAAFAAVALSACAATQTAEGPSERECFRNIDINGYSVVDERRVRVRIGPTREYVLTLNRDFRDADWTQAIAIRSPVSFVCTGNGLGVQVVGGDPEQFYQVISIERAPAEEAVEGS